MTDIDIRITDHEGQLTVSVTREQALTHTQMFEGCGESLSEAFADLSDQLADAGL